LSLLAGRSEEPTSSAIVKLTSSLFASLISLGFRFFDFTKGDVKLAEDPN